MTLIRWDGGMAASVLMVCFGLACSGTDDDSAIKSEAVRSEKGSEHNAGASDEAGSSVVPNTGEPSPDAVPKDEVALDEISPLGFSAEEASANLSQEYTGTMRYSDGTETSLTVLVQANRKPLVGPLAPGEPLAAVAVAADGNGEQALYYGVDVDFSTADGKFDEHFQADLMALSTSIARLSWGIPSTQIEGTYEAAEYTPEPNEDAFSGTIYLEVALEAGIGTSGVLIDTGLQLPQPDTGANSSGEFAEW